jgi:hypothetical protein
MYQYDFVKVELKRGREPRDNYHQIIGSKAKEGWRLVQIFTLPSPALGNPDQMELIFEKKTT